MKLWNKRKYAWLTMAVMTALFSGTTAMAATYDQQINEDLESNRTYWDGKGVRADGTYAFKEDAQLSVKSSAVNTGGQGYYTTAAAIFANGSDTTIDMGQHHLSAGLTVNNTTPKRAAALGVYSGKITIKNTAGIDFSVTNPYADDIDGYGIYIKPTYSGNGNTGLVIENGDAATDAVTYHNTQNSTGMYVETGDKAASLQVKGRVNIDVSGGSAAKGIVVKDNDYNTGDKTTVSIGGGKIKASGLAAEVSSGELDINAVLKDGVLTAAEGHRDVQIDGNIVVQKNGLRMNKHGTLALALNTGDSYLNGSITQGSGSGDAYVLMSQGASWKNGSSGSSLQSFAGGSTEAETGYIFRNAGGNLNLGQYSGFTTVFYDHSGDGTDASSYVGGDTVITNAAKGSGITLLTDKVDADNKDTLAKALNALASKLVYRAYTGGENNLAGKVGVAEGLTAPSKTLALEDITFTDEGRGSYEKNPQTVTEFITTITGVAASDTAYADGGVLVDGSYQFKKDSTITTTNQHGSNMNQATTIDATGKTLTFNTNSTDNSAKPPTIHAIGANTTDGVTITADKLVLNANSTKGRIEGISVGSEGQQNKDNPMKLTINGDTEMNVQGVGYTIGLFAAGNADVTLNGNVKAMGDAEHKWGLSASKGEFGYYGCSLVYSGSNYKVQMGPKITINGDVNAKIDGNGLFANGGSAKLTINGGGNIEINKDNTHNYYALLAESGTTSLNVNLDDNYQATSARDNKLVLKGNVTASTGAVNPNEPEQYTYVNLGLATADSEWTGVAYNKFGDAGKNSGSKTFYGAINVFLQNGATWNNEEWGEVEKNAWGAEAYNGSHLAKLIGGSDAAHAGNIFQKDENDLTIDNYSGYANIYYAHEGNGETADDYAAGDTIIKKAAAGSQISLITGNNDVAIGNKESVLRVLNALAGKLTYSAYASGEKNLTGYVKIAEGLTASSNALKTGYIAFDENGKGTCGKLLEKTAFTTTLTGNSKEDSEYEDNIATDGSYTFTKDSAISIPEVSKGDAKAIYVKKDLTINAKGVDLNLTASAKGNASAYGFFQDVGNDETGTAKSSTVTVGTLKTNVSGEAAAYSGHLSSIYLNGGKVGKRSQLTIDGNVDVTTKNTNGEAIGVCARGDADLTINGNVKANVNGQQTTTYYGVSGVYATAPYGGGKHGGQIIINGDVDLSGKGNGLFTNIGDARITVNGGGKIVVDKETNTEGYCAIRAEDGRVNMNMKLDAKGDATESAGHKVNIQGNVAATAGAINGQVYPEGMLTQVNLGLDTADSTLEGLVYDDFGDGRMNGGTTVFHGEANLWLSNGASWTNHEYGKAVASYYGQTVEGSVVSNFHGGKDEASTGYILQDDINDLTFKTYNGYSTIFYAHSGDGTGEDAYEDYGDVVIKQAAAGSHVTLVTDNTGIDTAKRDVLDKALNELAKKLVYSAYVQGKTNLSGKVEIASGLTASSMGKVFKSGDISFNKEDGRGFYDISNVQLKTDFTTAITGNLASDTEYSNAYVTTDDAYSFTKDSTITTTGAAIQAKKDLTVTSSKALSLKTTGTAINQADATKVNMTVSKLSIDAKETGNANLSGIYMKKYDANTTNVMNITGDVDITAVGKGSTFGINLDGNTALTINGNLKAKVQGASSWSYNGVNAVQAKGSTYRKAPAKVIVNGNVDIESNGDGLYAGAWGSSIVVNGGGNITVDKANKTGFAALRAEAGKVSMNVKTDESGNIIGSAGNDVAINGNIEASTSAVSKGDVPGKLTQINLGLDTAKSVLNGIVYNAFGVDGISSIKTSWGTTDLGSTYKGETNLWLSNGGVWNNEAYGNPSASQFTGSLVSNFHGGESDEKAGNIFQKDANSLTIDNYSGNTNIFYAHTGNGEAASDYAAGDTIIRSAAEGSVVSMITDNSGIAMDNKDSVANVLNALAGKLTYSNFVNGEKNLTGYVKIADGLTASSAALKTENITFNSENGKGGYVKPEKPVQTEFTTQIQGFAARDTEYVNAGITTGDQKYIFKKDSSITVGNKDAILGVAEIPADWVTTFEKTFKGVTVDAGENTLTLKTNQRAIYANGNSKPNITSNITAGKLLITANETSAYRDAAFAVATGGATLNINADIEGTVYGTNSASYGLYAEKGSKLTVNGDIIAVKENGYGIDGKTVSKNYGIRANDGTITVNGGVNMIVNGKAIAADKGTVNVNMNADLNGAADNTVILQGDVTASNGTVNLGLNTGTSKLTGAVSGNVNLYLANGASWDNTGAASSVAKLAGGASKAGNIFANSTNAMTIDNYSGNTNIFYAHTGNGEAASDYAAGDTIIRSAAEGSVVSMITDNSGIAMDNKDSVANVLNALAGKLTYSNFVNGEKNLTGFVKIADGLTASSAAMQTGNIAFSDTDGKGSLAEGTVKPGVTPAPNPQPGTGTESPKIEEGDYETFVMKGARSAVTTSFHSWRDNMQDTYTGADLADEDGIFAKALGGKTSSDVSGLKDSNSYWGAQIGYDKALANGWHTGVAFDYRDGDSDYLLGGKGDNKLYSFGVYGVKKMDNGSYFRVAAKAGRVENEYDVYTELRNKLHADYKANAYGLTAEYGKTFGSEMSYITPKVQLTWSRVGSKDYTGSANNGATMNIYQDSYDSLVGRLGFEAGMKKAHGSLHAGLYLAHEFNGDIDTRYFAKDGGWKSTSFDGDDTWAELVLGGEYRVGRNTQLYADFARDLGGDFQRKWKLNAGIRLRF